jgi:very-short-patch-repair endonuclease
VYNRTPQKAIRKRLRKDSPLFERLLWAKLRRAKVDDLKFRRQYGIGAYVVDFYCPAAKLGVPSKEVSLGKVCYNDLPG